MSFSSSPHIGHRNDEKNFLIVFTLCYSPENARKHFNGIGAPTYPSSFLFGGPELTLQMHLFTNKPSTKRNAFLILTILTIPFPTYYLPTTEER